MASYAWVRKKRFVNKRSYQNVQNIIQVIVFKDPTPAATSTPERKVTVSKVETAVQVVYSFWLMIALTIFVTF